MKKNVVFISNIEPGGITTVISHLIFSEKILSEIDISLFIFKKSYMSSVIKKMKKNVNVCNSPFNFKILNIIRLVIFLIYYSGDAVVSLGPKQILVARKIKKIFKKNYKIISWLQVSSNDPGIGSKIFFLKDADFNLAISSGMKKELNEIGIKNEKIGIIYNPIRFQDRIINPEKKDCKFIYVGRTTLDGQKNIRGLLNVMSKIEGNWTLDIYGSGKDFSNIKRIVSENDVLNNRVFLKGWNVNPFSEIGKANALLLNSNYEGFGMALAEAISYGVPCISTDCPVGPSDIIKTGINGYLYKINDYDSLKEQIEIFINHKKEFSPQKIKESINFLYYDKYDERFLKTIDNILNV